MLVFIMLILELKIISIETWFLKSKGFVKKKKGKYKVCNKNCSKDLMITSDCNKADSYWTAESLSLQNGRTVGLPLGAGVAVKGYFSFHLLSILVLC